MHPRKVHAQCGTTVHVKWSCCTYSHASTLKMKELLTAGNQNELVKQIKSYGIKLVKQSRAMECVEETSQRHEQDRTHRASRRASETQEQQALQRG